MGVVEGGEEEGKHKIFFLPSSKQKCYWKPRGSQKRISNM
jgi:hypothetical protein